MSEKDKIDILIESYKVISEESRNYLSEMMRCFLYAAIVLAIGLGYNKDYSDLKEHIPLAFLGLLVYFLSIGFQYVATNRYKAQIEHKINKISNDELLTFESKFKPNITRKGLLPAGINGKRLLPVPNYLIGVVTIVAFLYLIEDKDKLWQQSILIFCFILLGLYVFLITPLIIEKHQKRKGWIE